MIRTLWRRLPPIRNYELELAATRKERDDWKRAYEILQDSRASLLNVLENYKARLESFTGIKS
jgi:hypothetical protein